MVVFLFYILFFRRNGESKFGLFFLLGLVAVSLVDFAAPVQTYVSSGVNTGISIPFVVSSVLPDI